MGANDGNEAAYPGLRRRERIRAKGIERQAKCDLFLTTCWFPTLSLTLPRFRCHKIVRRDSTKRQQDQERKFNGNSYNSLGTSLDVEDPSHARKFKRARESSLDRNEMPEEEKSEVSTLTLKALSRN